MEIGRLAIGSRSSIFASSMVPCARPARVRSSRYDNKFQRCPRARYATAAAREEREDSHVAYAHGNGHGVGVGHARGNDKLAQRDFFLDVLNVSATRRDAKQYLSRFKAPIEQRPTRSPAVLKELRDRTARLDREQWQLRKTGVNLGGLYTPKAIADSPTFIHQLQQDQVTAQDKHTLHVALVSIRAPQTIDDHSLSGIALTLSQLVRLDMQIVLTFDCAELAETTNQTPRNKLRQVYQEQADRIVGALEEHNNAGARYIDGALAVTGGSDSADTSRSLLGTVNVAIPKLIVEPLKRTAIPVIPALACTDTFRTLSVKTADVMLALTRSLSGIASEQMFSEAPAHASTVLPSAATTLDRIIMIDPIGGLPSETREDKAHVFVNLEQEFDEIYDELHTDANPTKKQHLQTLDILRSCLEILPPASSALVISPEEAASSSQPLTRGNDSVGISTRRQKNALIHNLLTNKPVISSSLPVARLATPGPSPSIETATPTRSTLVKRGMPLIMVPDPRRQRWHPPVPGESTILLENHPEINFPRLLALIEDSFRRPLDVKHYLDRVRGRIAGVIIAGEYEGGAILTWEHPPNAKIGSPQDGSRMVPYLDKFAVLQRSQGASGVADIVFQAMVRSCFPSGVCWRSRQDNPVNKWYFERSRGTWHLEGSQWTMFWTTEDLVRDPHKWDDYVAVCRGVAPSWADSKKPD